MSTTAWEELEELFSKSSKPIQVLPPRSSSQQENLSFTKVTTNSYLGSITYNSGGILIDNGWLRILGCGSDKLPRTIKSWNESNQTQQYLLFADDAVGGFFALNGGALDADNLGKVFYLAPDSLAWECLDITHSQFIQWCISDNMNVFYQYIRWSLWKNDVSNLSSDRIIHFWPPPYTKEFDKEKSSRKEIPIQEAWTFAKNPPF